MHVYTLKKVRGGLRPSSKLEDLLHLDVYASLFDDGDRGLPGMLSKCSKVH